VVAAWVVADGSGAGINGCESGSGVSSLVQTQSHLIKTSGGIGSANFTQISDLLNYTTKHVRKLINTKITQKDAKCVIEYVGLSFLYLTYYKPKRLLQETNYEGNNETQNISNSVVSLVDDTYDKYVRLMLYLNRSISDIENNYEGVYILVPVSLNTYIYIWTNNIYSLQKYKELSISSKVPYLDMKPHTTVQYSGFNEIYMEVAFHQNISNKIENYTNPSKIARFKRTKINEKENSYGQEDIEETRKNKAVISHSMSL